MTALEHSGDFEVRLISPELLPAALREEVARGTPRVLVAGGDGTLGTAAAVLRGGTTELAIVPAGTLNHLAKDLALPEDLTSAIAVARAPTTTRIDLGAVNSHVFLNTCSVGAYVAFVRLRDRLERWLGYRLASLVAGIRVLVRIRTFRIVLEVDGVEREYETPLVFIGLGERELKLPQLGKRVQGGRRGLHVMVVRSRTGARLLALALAAVARGSKAVARTPALDAFLVDRLRIEPKRSTKVWRVAVDGETVAIDAPLEFTLLPEALPVVVPPLAPPKRAG